MLKLRLMGNRKFCHDNFLYMSVVPLGILTLNSNTICDVNSTWLVLCRCTTLLLSRPIGPHLRYFTFQSLRTGNCLVISRMYSVFLFL